jgi:biopolymer transport protein TolQ
LQVLFISSSLFVLFASSAYAADGAVGLIVDAVLLILILLSVAVWAIAGLKYKTLRSMQSRNRHFREVFWQTPDMKKILAYAENESDVPYAQLFIAADRSWKMSQKMNPAIKREEQVEQVERSVHAELDLVVSDNEKWLGLLATTASSAPFIGLFGTVVGILQSFAAIGQMKSASLAVVAPGLSEALWATAVGLVAAIPAAVFYNYLLRQVDRLRFECASFNADLINILTSLEGQRG